MFGRDRISLAVVVVLILSTAAGLATAYEFNNVMWDPRIFPIPYHINPVDAPDDFVSIVQDCVGQWHRRVESNMTFRFSGLANRGPENNDGYNTFSWNETGEDMDPAVLVETVVRLDNDGFIIECDTVLNGTFKWSTSGTPGPDEYDVKTAVLREVGRWVQLDYVSDPQFADSVMFETLAPGVVKHTLTQDDIDGIAFVYPAPHQPDPYEDADNDYTGATLLELNTPQTDHGIWPGDDLDWYRLTVSEETSYRIATSGKDPLGDTEIFLYDTTPPGEPIGHNDDIVVPSLVLPSTESVLGADGSYEFRVNVTEGVVPIGHFLYDVPAQADLVVASGAASPLNDVNTDMICTVIAVQEGGGASLVGVCGQPAPDDIASAPSISEIRALIGHDNWASLGDTRVHLGGRIEEDCQTVRFLFNENQNDDVKLELPTTPSFYGEDGSYEFRANIVAGSMQFGIDPLSVADVEDFVLASGDTPPFDDVNTAIIYALVGVREGDQINLVVVAGDPSPPEGAILPTNTEITSVVGHMMWARIGHARFDLGAVSQSMEPGAHDYTKMASPFYAVLHTPGLQPGVTYYVKVQSSAAGGRPVVDPYTIVLLPGIYDAFEWDNQPDPENARRIYSGDAQVRSIAPAHDIDWVTFELAEDAHVVIETFGPPGLDTKLILYDQSASIAENDDKDFEGEDWYSRIEIAKLPKGTYWILVSGPSGEVSGYTLEFHQDKAAGDLFEPDNTPQEANELVSYETQTHTIDPAGQPEPPEPDQDWMYFVLEETAYKVEIEITGFEDDDTYMELFGDTILTDPGAEPIEADDDSGDRNYSKITVMGLEAGQYFVRVREDGDDALTGEYYITMVAISAGDQYEPDNVPEYAKPVLPGVAMEHTLEPAYDVDWVTFTLPTSGDIIIETSGAEGGDTVISLYQDINGQLVLIAENDDIDVDEQNYYSRIDYDLAQAATYYLEVSGWWGAQIEQYFITLTYDGHPREPNDPGDVPELAMELTDDVPSTGHSLSPMQDIDWYKIQIAVLSDIEVQVTGQGVMAIELYNSSILGPSPGDPLASVSGEDSVVLRHLEMPPDTYYIKVQEPGQDELVLNYDILARIAIAPDFRASQPWLYFTGNWQEPPEPQKVIVRHLTQAVTWTSQTDATWLTVTPDSGQVSPVNDRGEWTDSTAYAVGDAVTHTYQDDERRTHVDSYLCVTAHTGPGDGSTHPSTDTTHWKSRNVEVSASVAELVGGNPVGLHEGQYIGTMTFTASDGSPPYESEVTLTITADPPVIQWDQSHLEFSATEGAIDPPPQEVTFENLGGGNMIQWSVEGDSPWISVENDSGTMLSSDPQATVSVHANVASLLPGAHTGNLVLHGFEGSPDLLVDPPSVTFTVSVDTVPPQPMDTTFAEEPHGVVGTTSIRMTAIETVDDQQGPIQYYFEFLGGDAGGADSGWILDRTFDLPGLVPGGYYTYRVKAADCSSQQNQTNFSGKMSGYVAPVPPPAPAVGSPAYDSLAVTPSRGTNSPRVEMAIYNATDGVYVDRFGELCAQPAWRSQDEWGTIVVVGLRGDTNYAFQVIARNGQGLESGPGPEGRAYTLDNAPPTPPPAIDGTPQFVGDSVTVACTKSDDQNGPVEYYFQFVGPEGEGSDSGWQTEQTYTMGPTTPGGQYGFRVKARDRNEYKTEFSETVAIYRAAELPFTPTQEGLTDSTITIGLSSGTNSAAVEYAIYVLISGRGGGWVDSTGNLAPQDVWQTLAEWGDQVTIKGFLSSEMVTVKVKARNGAGDQTDFCTPPLSVWMLDPDTFEPMPDTTPPAPDPMKWRTPPATSIESDSISLQAVDSTDNKGPVKYEYYNITTGQSSNWKASLQQGSVWLAPIHRFYGLDTCAPYEFKVRAMDALSHMGEWSETVSIYTAPNTPGIPSLIKVIEEPLEVAIDVHDNDNPESVEYAIVLQNRGKYVAGDGTMDSPEKVWQTREGWLNTLLQGYDINYNYSIAVIARNPDGFETPPGQPLVGKMDFEPPIPNPAVLLQATATPGEATLVAAAASDPNGVEFCFECTDGTFGPSGWMTSRTYQFTPPVTAVSAPFRVKYRDRFDNQTDWSSTKPLIIEPSGLANPISRGASGGTAFFSINRLKNARSAEYLIWVAGMAGDGFIDEFGAIQSHETWRTYDEWGDVVAVPDCRDYLLVQTSVRRPGGSVVVQNPIAIQIDVPPTDDTDPPTPATMDFAEDPAAGGPTSITMTSITAYDGTYPKYGFQREGQGEVWCWDRTYTEEGLMPGRLYRFRVRAKDMVDNMNNFSPWHEAYTHAVPPEAPTVVPHALSMDVSIEPGDNGTGVKYAIFDETAGKYVAGDKTLTSDTPVWKTIAEWGQPVVVPGIQPRSRHVFAVEAQNQDGIVTERGPSTEAIARDYDDQPPSPDPAAFDERPAAVSTTSFRAEAVTATDSTGPVEYNFTVQSPEGDAVDSGWQTSNVYQPAGLTPGGEYTVRVQVRDSSDSPHQNFTGVSDPATLYLNAEVPGTPVASDVQPAGVTLSFDTKTNSSETLYCIFETRTGRYVNDSGILVSFVPAWRFAAQWGASFTVTGLQPESLYYFTAAARSKDEVVSAYSPETQIETSEATLTTPDAPTVPSGHLGCRALKLQINAPGCAPGATFLIRVTRGTVQYVQASGTLAATEVWQTLEQWDNPAFVTGLAPDTTYEFDVRASLGGQFSDWGPATQVLTNIEGDADGNDKVNIIDMIAVRNYINQDPASGTAFRADVNGDGRINIIDMIAVRNRINTKR